MVLGLVVMIAGIGAGVGGSVNIASAVADDEIFTIKNAVKIGEIALGEYPQTYVGNALNQVLKTAAANEQLTKTGEYTNWDRHQAIKLPVYSYYNQKYAQLQSATKTWYRLDTSNSPDEFMQSLNGRQIGMQEFANGDAIKDGQEYWFKVEPITWNVYSVGERYLAVAQNILYSDYFGANDTLSAAANETGGIWADATVRVRLNDFATTCGLDAKYITQIKHYETTAQSETAGQLVEDALFIPSYGEFCELIGKDALRKIPTDLTRVTQIDSFDQTTGVYATRSFGNCKNDLNLVYSHQILFAGENGVGVNAPFYAVDYPCLGVVPAFVLNVTKDETRTVAATCTTAGYDERYLVVGGEEISLSKTNVVVASGHAWSEWKTTKEPSCSAAGERQHTCATCQTTETEELPKLEHAWGEWQTTTEATATTTGAAERECALCHIKQTRVLPATAADNSDRQKWMIFGLAVAGICAVGAVIIITISRLTK